MRAQLHPQFAPTTRGVLTTSGLETFCGVRPVCTETPAFRRKDLNQSKHKIVGEPGSVSTDVSREGVEISASDS